MTAAFFLLFSWFMVTAKTRRQVVAITLVGTATAAMVAPRPVMAQASLAAAIQAVLNVINGLIQSALNSINSVMSLLSNFYQTVIWPVNLINQARAQITQMINQYRSRMLSIFNINLNSATLGVTQQLESIIRNAKTSDFTALTTAYGNAYGAIPATTAASLADRAMMDMDDALALDNLKTLKATDNAGALTLQAADQLERAASQAAPGSAPFLTASAVVASIQSQAVIQRMLAAELRQEAARLAHDNAKHKRVATSTNQLGDQILNLLKQK